MMNHVHGCFHEFCCLQHTIPLLFDDCPTIEIKLCQLWDKLNNLINDYNEFKSDFFAWKQEVEEVIEEMLERLDDLERRMDEAEKRLDALEDRMDKVENRLDKIENRLDVIEAQIKDIYATLEDLQSQINKIDSRVTNLESSVSQIEKRVTNLESSVSQLQQDFSSLQSTVNNLQTQLNSLSNNYTSLQTDLSDLEKRVSSLETQLASFDIIPPEELFNSGSESWWASNFSEPWLAWLKEHGASSSWSYHARLHDGDSSLGDNLSVGRMGQLCVVCHINFVYRRSLGTSMPSNSTIYSYAQNLTDAYLATANDLVNGPYCSGTLYNAPTFNASMMNEGGYNYFLLNSGTTSMSMKDTITPFLIANGEPIPTTTQTCVWRMQDATAGNKTVRFTCMPMISPFFYVYNESGTYYLYGAVVMERT